MTTFRVNPAKLNRAAGDLERQKAFLMSYKIAVAYVRCTLGDLGSAGDSFKRKLQCREEDIEKMIGHVDLVSGKMKEISSFYSAAERSAAGQFSAIEQVRQDLSPQTLSYIQSVDWSSMSYEDIMIRLLLLLGLSTPISTILAIIANYIAGECAEHAWVQNYSDEETREYLEQYSAFRDELYDSYSNASGAARAAYDRYMEDIRIQNMNDPGGGAYYLNGDGIYLDYNELRSDQRGMAAIWYHECGHNIVYESGWLDLNGNFTNHQFRQFADTVHNEVRNYVRSIENGYRNQYSGMGYSGDQLEAMVHAQTENYLRDILGGENFHTYDGVSDMINAATNNEYFITYGHPDVEGSTYWDQLPSMEANEAFANIFSADFNHDRLELDFIREHFPETYEAYTNLLNSIV